MLYRSRSFSSVPDKSGAIVPLADKFNHGFDADARWYYDKQKEGFVISAKRDIAKGE